MVFQYSLPVPLSLLMIRIMTLILFGESQFTNNSLKICED
jgi:hypothetical protein